MTGSGVDGVVLVSEAVAVDELTGIRDSAKAMAAAARIANNKQAEADMMAIRFRAERRLGEIMAAQRDAGMMSDGGRPKTGSASDPVSAPVTLAEVGIDKHLADRARKYAAIPEREFEDRIDSYRESVAEQGERAIHRNVSGLCRRVQRCAAVRGCVQIIRLRH